MSVERGAGPESGKIVALALIRLAYNHRAMTYDLNCTASYADSDEAANLTARCSGLAAQLTILACFGHMFPKSGTAAKKTDFINICLTNLAAMMPNQSPEWVGSYAQSHSTGRRQLKRPHP